MAHFEMDSSSLYQYPIPEYFPEECRCWLILPQAEEVFFDVMNGEMREILAIFDREKKTYPQVRVLTLLSNIFEEEDLLRIRDFFPNLTRVSASYDEDAPFPEFLLTTGPQVFGDLWINP